MKVVDIIIYVLYTASAGKDGRVGKGSREEKARDYLGFVIASLVALLLTIGLFKIGIYKKSLQRMLPPLYVILLGLAQAVITWFIAYFSVKRYYTDEKIQQIDAAYAGTVSKSMAVVLYVILFIVHTCSFLYLIFKLLFLLASKSAA